MPVAMHTDRLLWNQHATTEEHTSMRPVRRLLAGAMEES